MPPGWRDAGGQVLCCKHSKASLGSKPAVMLQCFDGREGSRLAQVIEKERFGNRGSGGRGPAGEGCSPARDKSAGEFPEKGRFVRHVVEGFDGEGGFETLGSEVIFKPVAMQDPHFTTGGRAILCCGCGL